MAKKKQEKTFLNEVTLSMYLHEVEEKKKCNIYKCSFNNGKDENGEYRKSTPISVIAMKDTDEDIEVDYTGWVTVKGHISFSYSEYKGKTYTNVTIFADYIGEVE